MGRGDVPRLAVEDRTRKVEIDVAAVTCQWPDGSFDANVDGRPSDYSRLGRTFRQNVRPGDSILLAHLEGDKDQAWCLKPAAGHRASRGGAVAGSSTTSWPWYEKAFDRRCFEDTVKEFQNQATTKDLSLTVDDEILGLLTGGGYLWVICDAPNRSVYEIHPETWSVRRSVETGTIFGPTNTFAGSDGLWTWNNGASALRWLKYATWEQTDFAPPAWSRQGRAFAFRGSRAYVVSYVMTGGTKYFRLERWTPQSDSVADMDAETQLVPDADDPGDVSVVYQLLVLGARIVTCQNATSEPGDDNLYMRERTKLYLLGGAKVRVFDENLNEVATAGPAPTTAFSPNEGFEYTTSRTQYRVLGGDASRLYCLKLEMAGEYKGSLWADWTGSTLSDFCDVASMSSSVVAIDLTTGMESWSWTPDAERDAGTFVGKVRRLYKRVPVGGGPETILYDQSIEWDFVMPWHVRETARCAAVTDDVLVVGKGALRVGEFSVGASDLSNVSWHTVGSGGGFIYWEGNAFYFALEDSQVRAWVTCLNKTTGALRWERELELANPIVSKTVDQEGNRGQINVARGDYFCFVDHERADSGSTTHYYRVNRISDGGAEDDEHFSGYPTDYGCVLDGKVYTPKDGTRTIHVKS